VRALVRRNLPGPYQVQAAIAAVHSDADSAADTDWGQIVALYDQLLVFTPSPVVSLNRAVAVAEQSGPGPALELIDGLAADLVGYYLLHAARAELLVRLGRAHEALATFDRALSLTSNEAEHKLLEERRTEAASQG